MKYFFIPLLVFTNSCASLKRDLKPPPKFSKESVCSPRALEYSTKEHRKQSSVPPAATSEKIEALRVELEKKFEAPTMKCYEAELYRTDNIQPFNLCLVLGTDEKGRIEFHDFHTSEIGVTDAFYECLNESIKALDLSQHRSLKVVQPYGFPLADDPRTDPRLF